VLKTSACVRSDGGAYHSGWGRCPAELCSRLQLLGGLRNIGDTFLGWAWQTADGAMGDEEMARAARTLLPRLAQKIIQLSAGA
jgi:hypothetical protein